MDRHEIEAQIEANPYDDAPYLILADVLQLAGDPRGELIAIDAAAMRANSSERTLWRRRRAELLQRHPELAIRVDAVDLEWHLGFVRRVTLYDPRYYGNVFEHPSARFVTEIAFARGAVIGHLDLVPLLRVLVLGDPDGRWWTAAREPIVLDDRVPQLAQLERIAASEPITIRRAPRLRELQLHANPETCAWLATADLPALERLVLQLQPRRQPEGETTPPSFADLRPLLERSWPRLRELSLVEPACGDALLEGLATSPVLPQLRVLRLWNAGLTGEGARHVTRAKFGHLDLLDVSDPLIDDATIAMLDGACREVRTLSPRLRALVKR